MNNYYFLFSDRTISIKKHNTVKRTISIRPRGEMKNPLEFKIFFLVNLKKFNWPTFF